MDIFLLKLARHIEEYSGIFIKKEAVFNFKRVVEQTMKMNNMAWNNYPFDRDFIQQIVEGLIIRETYFFRDPRYLEALKEYIIKKDGPVSIASLGVSSGEEAYTVAMFLMEHDLLDRVSISGYDIARTSLDIAEKGIYTSYSLRHTEEQYMKYFEEVENGFEINSEIKNTVSFQQFNIMHPGFFKPVTTSNDILLVRNILIYFKNKLEDIVSNITKLIHRKGLVITTPVELEKAKILQKKGLKVIAK